MRTRLPDALVAGALAVLMLLWLWQASRLPYTVEGRPGPGFFPVWLSAVGALLSLSVLVTAVRKPPPSDEPSSRWAGTVRLVGALLGAVAFLVLIPVLGFIVGLGLYLTYLCLVVMRIRVVSGLALSLGTAAVIYLVFGLVLDIPFPTGVMGI